MKPVFVDTHAHLDFPEFDSDREAAIERARERGVEFIINIGTDLERSSSAVEIASRHNGLFAAVGIHPHHAAEVKDADWTRLEKLASHPRVVAVGEVGLDYYRPASPQACPEPRRRVEQRETFLRLISLARRRNLPVIIHSREAHEETLSLLKEHAQGLLGVMHCFSGDKAVARTCLEMGFNISFTANITYPNADALRDVVRFVPVERVLLETDSPFLAPQAFRGKRNEPAYVVQVAETIAQLKNLSVEDVARITSLGAFQLFGVGHPPEKGKIAYPIRDSLYINLTSRCSNLCTFCIRGKSHFVKGHHLALERDPTLEEVLVALKDIGKYKEVVFCGYGEPTERFDALVAIAKFLKEKGVKVRLVTNGQGNLINRRSILKELKGLVDAISVSLNTADPSQYLRISRSRFAEEAYAAVLEFIREARSEIGQVEITALDIPEVDIEKVRQIARALGVSFRLRQYDEVG